MDAGDGAIAPYSGRGDSFAHWDAATKATAGETPQDAADMPPVDAAPDAASSLDAGAREPQSEASAEPGVAADAGTDAPTYPSCLVTFVVKNAPVDWIVYGGVAIGGNTDQLGNFDAYAALPLAPGPNGDFGIVLNMRDGEHVEFRFVLFGSMTSKWESWGPDSNRSLIVTCKPDDGGANGTDAGDGGAEATLQSKPARGTRYDGEFDVKPPDAT